MRATMQRLSMLFRGTKFPNVPELNAHFRMKREGFTVWATRIPFTVFFLLAFAALPSVTRADVPVFVITPEDSSIKFFVKASVAIQGTFDKWSATITFKTPEAETGVLDIKIQADSVNTGSGMKNGVVKGKDFFDVKNNPLITFVSKKLVQTGPETFEAHGDFTIRGVTKAEMLTLRIGGKGTGSGSIKGTMSFDRKDYGMNHGIPFIEIADRVEVTVDLKVKRTSGPPLQFKQ